MTDTTSEQNDALRAIEFAGRRGFQEAGNASDATDELCRHNLLLNIAGSNTCPEANGIQHSKNKLQGAFLNICFLAV